MTKPPWYDGEPSEANYPDPPDVAEIKAAKRHAEMLSYEKKSQRQAAKVVADFEIWCRRDEMRGSEHPDLRDWVHDCYLVARRRLRSWIAFGTPSREKMPPQPEIDYDR